MLVIHGRKVPSNTSEIIQKSMPMQVNTGGDVKMYNIKM